MKLKDSINEECIGYAHDLKKTIKSIILMLPFSIVICIILYKLHLGVTDANKYVMSLALAALLDSIKKLIIEIGKKIKRKAEKTI